MSIISISDLELLPNVTVDDDDKATYEMLIEAVQEEAEKITNRLFDQQDLDEVYDMDGSEITLNQSPVNSISSVSYGNPFGDVDRTVMETTDYIRYDQLGVIRLNITARRSPQYARVQYNAGWSSSNPSQNSNAPADLKFILSEEVQIQFKTKYVDPLVKSDRGGDYKVEYFSNSDLGGTSSFAKKLSKYIRSA